MRAKDDMAGDSNFTGGKINNLMEKSAATNHLPDI
jgi:hypothetical protein